MNREKISKYFLITLGIFIFYELSIDFFSKQPKLKEKGRYTIAYVYRYSKHKGGTTIFYKYNIGNKAYYDTGGGEDNEKDYFLNKRFLVKYVEGEEDLSDILLEYPVPDSIKEAPSEGWKKIPEWAKKK